MRLAILSDVHANLEALEATLRAVEEQGADAVYCLGDVVGYGPDPGPCVELVRTRAAACVLGNHDLAVATGEGIESLPRDGREAARLHQRLLGDDDRAWLAALPLRLEVDGCTLVHASPEAPAEWRRLTSYGVVQAQFAAFDTPICFIGHSHAPSVVSDRITVLRVRPGARFLVNVGSVGQPRDGDPRAAFALFDTEAFACEIVRVPYPVEHTAAKVLAAGLPATLGERLRRGV